MDIPSTYSTLANIEKYNNKNILLLLVFFVVWPFGAFLYAVYNYNKKESLLIFVLFTGLFSYAMQSNSSLYDLERVLKIAEIYAAKADSDFFSIVTGLYGDADDGGVDIYLDFVSFVVSRFTNNGHVLLLFFGLMYGVLFAKCISSLLTINNTRNYQTGLLLLSFSMIFSMDQIAGVRFATASYLFFYGLLNYFRTNNSKYLFILSLSSLVHFSYLSVIALLIIYIYTKPTEKVLYCIVAISYLAGTIFQGAMISIFGFLGGSIEKRANLYLGVEGANDYVVWFVDYKEELMLAFIVVFFIVSKLMKKKIVETVLSLHLFRFSMLVLILSNFAVSIPDAGYRFTLVFILIFMAYVYVSYNQNFMNVNLNKLYSYAPLFFVLQIFFASRNILFYSPLMLFYGSSPLFVFMGDTELLTWDFIQTILK